MFSSITALEAAVNYRIDEGIIKTVQQITQAEVQDFYKTAAPAGMVKSPYFEYFADTRWRQFLFSVYYADLICYAKPEDQADFSRLCYILNKFPEGFTVWHLRCRAGVFPAGYTGWYYVDASVFELLLDRRHPITGRFFLPAPVPTPYVYLFNYSIAPPLLRSGYSKALIQDYASALAKIPYTGRFCAVVSEDGARIAKRFGMSALRNTDAGDTIYIDAPILKRYT